MTTNLKQMLCRYGRLVKQWMTTNLKQKNASSGLSAEYIPMLNQLRTMQSLDLTMVNEMLREVYVNDILAKKDKKNPLRGYRR